MTSKLLFSVAVEAVFITIGLVVWGYLVIRAVFVIWTVVGRVVGFVSVAKAAFILFTIFFDVSRALAFVTSEAVSCGRLVRGRDESGSDVGELAVPSFMFD